MINLENKKLMAIFMGYEILHDDDVHPYVDIFPNNDDTAWTKGLPMLEFHFEDFDSLMLVVGKIESFLDENQSAIYNVLIQQSFVDITINHTSEEIVCLDRDNKIEAIFDACVHFINWFNKQK